MLSVRAACAEFLLNGVTCIADRLGNMDRIAPGIEAVGHPRRRRPFAGRCQGAGRTGRRPTRCIERYGTDPRRRVFGRHRPARARHLLRCAPDASARGAPRRPAPASSSMSRRTSPRSPPCARRGHDGALACLVATGLADAPAPSPRTRSISATTEFEAWPAHGIAIAHCPASNLKIEARTLPLARLAGRVPIGLGTDWTAIEQQPWTCWPRRGWRPSSARCGPTTRRCCRSNRWCAC